MDGKYKILIIEDNKTIAKELQKYLSSWNYNVEIISDFKHVLESFIELRPHLVLLDISLPYYDGYYWCEKIRHVSSAPIVIISSAKDKMSQIMAMTMGADDFIEKPFDLDILTAKIKALIRRAYDFTAEADLIQHKGVILNLYDNTVAYKNERFDLSKNEYKILRTLMLNKGKTVSRDNIMLELWDTDNFIDDNTLTVNVSRLREKLSTLGVDDFIKTKKGLGYVVK